MGPPVAGGVSGITTAPHTHLDVGDEAAGDDAEGKPDTGRRIPPPRGSGAANEVAWGPTGRLQAGGRDEMDEPYADSTPSDALPMLNRVETLQHALAAEDANPRERAV